MLVASLTEADAADGNLDFCAKTCSQVSKTIQEKGQNAICYQTFFIKIIQTTLQTMRHMLLSLQINARL